MHHHYLACDLGAESGRLILGTLEDHRLTLEELHRFPNGAVTEGGSLCWNLDRLKADLKAGLRRAAERQLPIASLSTDSWGVDYVLVNEAGEILKPTFHYRDARCQEGLKRAHARVSQESIFAETGIQFMAINTIFQLASENPERLRGARHLLMIADVFNYLLSGTACVEVSNASTSQLYNPRTRSWSTALIHALELPAHVFPPIVASGTRLGPLRPALAAELGVPPFEIIAGCSHDTGAAVVAVPASAELSAATDSAPDWAYLSSGTWSLLGCELREPLVTDACRDANFTNEIGYGNSVRLLKNIAGLWLVQECRRAWKTEGKEYSYAELVGLAETAVPFRSLVNPSDDRFLSPGDMPAKIAAFCVEHGFPEPRNPGETIRCCLESLALAYATNLRQLERLVGGSFRRLHIVGGGSQNDLLNRLTADACGVDVIAGPVEATAAGNVLVQAMAQNHLPSLASAREVIRQSFPMKRVVPGDSKPWQEPLRWYAPFHR